MGFNKDKLQQILQYHKGLHNSQDAALVHDETTNIVQYAVSPANVARASSAIVELIQALNDRDNTYYKLLKKISRVHSLAEPTLMEAEMAAMNNITLVRLPNKVLPKKFTGDDLPAGEFIRVQTNRWTQQSPLSGFAVPQVTDPMVALGGGIEQKMHTVDRLYMLAAFALVTRRFVNSKDDKNGNIGALLVSPSGKILAWALNTKQSNSTLHAEVNLMQSYFYNVNNPKIKWGTRLYTTLKPCRMCAGIISHVGENNIRVFYGQNDTGDDATNTCLDKQGKQQPMDGNDPNTKMINWGTRTNKESMMALLESEREKTKSQMRMVKSLAQHDVKRVMSGAVRILDAKMKKYGMTNDSSSDNEQKLNENVQKVLNHIIPFLRALGAAPEQITQNL